MNLIGKILGKSWGIVFIAFVAATFYEANGGTLPWKLSTYRETFQNWFVTFLSSPIFFVVFAAGWLTVSHQLGGKSGWRQLASRYPDTSGLFSHQYVYGSGHIGEVSHQGALQVAVNSREFVLRLLIPFRFGNPNLSIPWADVESITIRKSAFPPEDENFLDKLMSRASTSVYAHIRLSSFLGQKLAIPWNEDFGKQLPAGVSVIDESD